MPPWFPRKRGDRPQTARSYAAMIDAAAASLSNALLIPTGRYHKRGGRRHRAPSGCDDLTILALPLLNH